MRDIDRTLAALADPHRRAIVELLRGRSRRPGELAKSLHVSGPALSRHLRILRGCGLVEEEKREHGDARVRLYRLKTRPLQLLRRWVDEVETFWARELRAFQTHVETKRRAGEQGSPVSSPPGSDAAKASVLVAVPPGEAFDLFTREIDAWWRQGPAYRIGGRSPGALCFEPGPGGRLFQTYRARGELRTFEIGRVVAWEPPSFLAFEWRGTNFKPYEKTLVEVRFAPQGGGTMVSVTHSGWGALPTDHPVRHCERGPEFIRRIGLWWGGLLTSLRSLTAQREDH